jgi:hypothetical protein
LPLTDTSSDDKILCLPLSKEGLTLPVTLQECVSTNILLYMGWRHGATAQSAVCVKKAVLCRSTLPNLVACTKRGGVWAEWDFLKGVYGYASGCHS